MSEVTTTTWTCCRCGAVETKPGIEQPETWIRVFFANPPRGAVDKHEVGDLCNPCGGYLVDFVHNREQEAIERDRTVAQMMAEIEASIAAENAINEARPSHVPSCGNPPILAARS